MQPAISHGGETAELGDLTERVRRRQVPVVLLTAAPASTLARLADLVVVFPDDPGADPGGVVAMGSTLAVSAWGDALAYVLNNYRRHGEDRSGIARTWKADPFSSCPVFTGWQELADLPFLWPLRPTYHPLIVFRPRTWLLARGWQEHYPLISTREIPGN